MPLSGVQIAPVQLSTRRALRTVCAATSADGSTDAKLLAEVEGLEKERAEALAKGERFWKFLAHS